MGNNNGNYSKKRVYLLDTTLRDGEQTPGIVLTKDQKVLIAKKLDELGIDIIEGGTAIASKGEQEALQSMVKEKLNSEIASFCRILTKDIEAAITAEVDSICLTFPSSDLHITKKLNKTREQVKTMVYDCIEFAKSHGLIVHLLAEDGSRADLDFLLEVFKGAEALKVNSLTVCDTVGILSPEKTQDIYNRLSKELQVPLGIHCHNDLGLALANTLSAIRANARLAHGTMNGLGERTGNTAMEEIAMALKLFYNIDTLKLEKIYEASKLIEGLTKFEIPINKPLIGKNVFTHESGIHVDGILKDSKMYEPFSPELLGRKRQIMLGKLSGIKTVKLKLEEFGFTLTPDQEKVLTERVKELGDKGKTITDADFLALVYDVLGQRKERKIVLKDFVAVSGSSVHPTASVRLIVNNEEKVASALGNGPVDATLNAIRNLVGNEIDLAEYHVDAITGGTDAMVKVTVVLKKGDKKITSSATSTDIVYASVEAVLRGIDVLIDY
ncbi:MAG: 2-isopropylmalate synthase [Candidatus Micrarchaeota archaeon]|nr:2-isopropylmalate synthase [Candidatus Micrarchaeota archaeon]